MDQGKIEHQSKRNEFSNQKKPREERNQKNGYEARRKEKVVTWGGIKQER